MATGQFHAEPRGMRADAAVAALILLLGGFLAWSGAQLTQRLHASAALRRSVSFEDHVGAAANTAGLIVVAWWVLSFVIAVAAALFERGGRRRAAAAAGKFSPAFMRRLALAAVGLQLATAPLAQAANDPSGAATVPPSAAAAAWVPASEPPPSPAPRNGAVRPHWTPTPAPPDPGSLAAVPLRAQEPATGVAEVTVRAGDSLWGICAESLGPLATDVDIALAWPRLYQANRDVIGPDPGLLLPGQVLKMPASP